MMDRFDTIRQSLVDDEENATMRNHGWQPLYSVSVSSKIAVIGRAPGRHAQTSGVPWNDASGKNLIDWLGVTEGQFRDPELFALLPMNFYYPELAAAATCRRGKGSLAGGIRHCSL